MESTNKLGNLSEHCVHFLYERASVLELNRNSLSQTPQNSNNQI